MHVVIFLVEALMNFESLRQSPIIRSDLMAAASMIGIGLFILGAYHFVGTFIKGFYYYTQPANRMRALEGWPRFGLGVLALLIALGIVATARYYYILPEIIVATELGLPPPNLFVAVGSLILGNVGCFVVGVIGTFALNDSNPEYQKVAIKREKLMKKYDSLYKREVGRELRVADDRFTQERDAAEGRRSQMIGKPGYDVFQREAARLLATDEKVVAVLRTYRDALAQQIRNAGTRTRFYKPEFENVISGQKIEVPSAELSTLPLRLYLRG
ncbi:hypothetical protein [Hyphomonas sp.]|uniref:hypothetical protein n=1 Tax=Hyphomonas sp. TaxID=87 RepID=UPI00391BBD7F